MAVLIGMRGMPPRASGAMVPGHGRDDTSSSGRALAVVVPLQRWQYGALALWWRDGSRITVLEASAFFCLLLECERAAMHLVLCRRVLNRHAEL